MPTLIRIGNSQGVRIPKAIIDQARLNDTKLEFRIMDEGLLIQPVRKPREGWKEQFQREQASRADKDIDQEWLDAPLVDDQDWEW